MNLESMNEIHVTYGVQLRRFTSIHKSCPVASWDSKVSMECALQNLDRSSRCKADAKAAGLLWLTSTKMIKNTFGNCNKAKINILDEKLRNVALTAN